MVGAESEEPGINRKGTTVWVHYHHVGIKIKKCDTMHCFRLLGPRTAWIWQCSGCPLNGLG